MRKLLAIIAVVLLVLVSFLAFGAVKVAADADQLPWLDGFTYRKSHVLNQTLGASSGHIVGFMVYMGNGVDGSVTVGAQSLGKVYLGENVQPDFSDVRFTNDEMEMLPQWIETYSTGVSAKIWVSLDVSLIAGAATVYIYWGNEMTVSYSDGDAVFPFFEDFEDNAVWERQGLVIPTPSTNYVYAEPTVIYENGSQIIETLYPVFKMWFRVEVFSPSNYYIAYTESLDGENWETPITVIDDSSAMLCPYVFKNGTTYYCFHRGQGGDQFDRWTSPDGVTWTNTNDNVLNTGAGGQWDDSTLGNMFILPMDNGTWFMLYEATGDNAIYWAGVAWSNNLGVTWTKYGSNPVMGDASLDVGGMFVKRLGDNYYCWFHGGEHSYGLPTDGCFGYSSDLFSWTTAANPEIFPRTEEYEGVGESEGQISDIHIIQVNGTLFMFYEGVHDQSDHRGIALAKSGASWGLIVNSTQNKAYDETTHWSGNLGELTAPSGIGTYYSTGSAWKKAFANVGLLQGSRLVYNCTLTGTGATHGQVIGYAEGTGASYVDVFKMDTERMRSQSGGSGFTYTDFAMDESRHYYEIIRLAAGQYTWVDGVLKATITATKPGQTLYPLLQAYGTTITCDWIYGVDEYLATEVSHYTWGSLETWESYPAPEPPTPEPEPGGDDSYFLIPSNFPLIVFLMLAVVIVIGTMSFMRKGKVI